MLQYKRTREKGKFYTVYRRALSDYIPPKLDNAVLNNLHHNKCITLTIIAIFTNRWCLYNWCLPSTKRGNKLFIYLFIVSCRNKSKSRNLTQTLYSVQSTVKISYFYSFWGIYTKACEWLILRHGRGCQFTNQVDNNHVLSDIQSHLKVQVAWSPITKLTEGDAHWLVWLKQQLVLLVI